MINNLQGVGIDCVDVNRFLEFKTNKDHPFLKKVFFEDELHYCFSYQNVEVHLAGFFALKEATSKALGVNLYPFAEIEVKHNKDGAPEVWNKGKKLDIKVSISHTNSVAVAIAVA
jgi:phosphopantetheine--protein transferase-like protein